MFKNLFNINTTIIFKKIWIVPFSIYCTIIFIWIVNSYASAINLKENDLANWTTLAIEAGILLPIAYIIGNHFFKKDEENNRQKEIKIMETIIKKLEKSRDRLLNLIKTYEEPIDTYTELKNVREELLFEFTKNIQRIIETIKNKRLEDEIILRIMEDIIDYHVDIFTNYIDNDEANTNYRFINNLNEVIEKIEMVINTYKMYIQKQDN